MKILTALLVVAVSVTTFASEQKEFVDLSQNNSTSRIHEPSLTFGSGGTIIPVDGAQLRQASLRISLLPLGRSAFRRDEDVIYELRIENVSKQVVSIPWDPRIVDVEPEGPSQQYGYKQVSVSLWFMNENKITEASNASILYGIEGLKGSFLQLAPGHQARIRARARLSFQDERFSCVSDCRISARASISFSTANVTLENSQYREQIQPEGLPIISENAQVFEMANPER
jgi:hypothetical protein